MRYAVKSPEGKVWGYIDGDTYYTHRRFSKHYCRKHHGWGIQLTLYWQLKQEGVLYTVVFDDEKKMKYRSKLTDWEERGVSDILRPRDGEQLFLSLNFFQTSPMT